MNRIIPPCIFMVTLLLASASWAYLVHPYSVDGPQDPLIIKQEYQWHELGTPLPSGQSEFPPDEAIEAWYYETDLTACTAPNGPQDSPNIPNFIIQIKNNTNISWIDLHYVADLDTTTISNFDGTIGNVGAQDDWLAFRIDNIGLNKPLISESIKPDLVFQPGEIWEFIVQDYRSPAPPNAFGSLGIAGRSSGFPPSGASIIARPVPIPGSGLLLVLGLGGLILSRRRTSLNGRQLD